jgi:hypothetical protein
VGRFNSILVNETPKPRDFGSDPADLDEIRRDYGEKEVDKLFPHFARPSLPPAKPATPVKSTASTTSSESSASRHLTPLHQIIYREFDGLRAERRREQREWKEASSKVTSSSTSPSRSSAVYPSTFNRPTMPFSSSDTHARSTLAPPFTGAPSWTRRSPRWSRTIPHPTTSPTGSPDTTKTSSLSRPPSAQASKSSAKPSSCQELGVEGEGASWLGVACIA